MSDINYFFGICSGLHSLLEYEGDDVEEVFCLNFIVSREVFGDVRTDELKPHGANIPVTQKNKYLLLLLTTVLFSVLRSRYLCLNHFSKT